MQWEADAAATETANAAEVSMKSPSQAAADLQKAMGEIINASLQVKELQREYQASIDNIRQQYFLMGEAADKHVFL